MRVSTKLAVFKDMKNQPFLFYLLQRGDSGYRKTDKGNNKNNYRGNHQVAGYVNCVLSIKRKFWFLMKNVPDWRH